MSNTDKGRGMTDQEWSNYSSAAQTKPIDQIFTQTTIKSTPDPRTSFDPKTISVRESRDSDLFPNSTPIILGFDVTGTMGDIPYHFVQKGLGILIKEIYDRKPVSDPQIMCMAIGDARTDTAPLQTTQFETDMRIVKQLEELYLEGNGGGNNGESYNLAHCFAAHKTSTDCYEKRGKKGQLYTIGDEPPVYTLKREHAKKFVGFDPGRDLSSEELIEMARKQYDVFHVIVEQGAGLGQYGEKAVVGGWNKLLGEDHVLRLSDYTKLSEVVISQMQRNAGVDYDAVVKSWSGNTSLVVAHALSGGGAVATQRPGAKKTGVVRLPQASAA